MITKRLVSLWALILVWCLDLYAEVPNHKIYYYLDSRAPLTHIEIVYLGGGYRQEAREHIGISRITARMFLNVAKDIGIVEQLENLGADLDVKVDEEAFTISLSVLSENLRKTLEITNHLINDLSFSEEDLEQAKKQQAAEYDSVLHLQGKSLELMVRYALYAGKEKGKSISLKALQEIQLEEIRRHYSKLIRAQTVFFQVISDLDYDTIARYLSTISRKRRNDGLRYLEASKEHKSPRNICYIFNYPQSSVDYCTWLIPIEGESRPELGLVMASLKNNAYGILFRHFREHLQLCYTAYGISRMLGPKQFIEIFADPPENKSRKLIPEMVQYIQSLHTNQTFDSGIDELKHIYKNSYVFKISPSRCLRDAVLQDLYGIPALNEEAFRKQVDSITREQVHTFLTNTFRPENFLMVIIGDWERIDNLMKEKLPNVSVEVPNPFELIE